MRHPKGSNERDIRAVCGKLGESTAPEIAAEITLAGVAVGAAPSASWLSAPVSAKGTARTGCAGTAWAKALVGVGGCGAPLVPRDGVPQFVPQLGATPGGMARHHAAPSRHQSSSQHHSVVRHDTCPSLFGPARLPRTEGDHCVFGLTNVAVNPPAGSPVAYTERQFLLGKTLHPPSSVAVPSAAMEMKASAPRSAQGGLASSAPCDYRGSTETSCNKHRPPVRRK
jgi:hypothetical protein